MDENKPYGDLPWYKVPLKTCPICQKQFAPALEHAWCIGKAYLDTPTCDYRNIPVCSYTCMRKWEKEQENACNKSCDITYSAETLKRLPEVITDYTELIIAERYFRYGYKIKDIAAYLNWSERTITRRIKKLKTIIDKLEEQQ